MLPFKKNNQMKTDDRPRAQSENCSDLTARHSSHQRHKMSCIIVQDLPRSNPSFWEENTGKGLAAFCGAPTHGKLD